MGSVGATVIRCDYSFVEGTELLRLWWHYFGIASLVRSTTITTNNKIK